MASVSKPRQLKNGDLSYRLYESKGFDSNGKHIREDSNVFKLFALAERLKEKPAYQK